MKTKKKAGNKAVEVILFEKGKRGILRMLFGRTGVVILLLLVQLSIVVSIFQFLQTFIPFALGTIAVFTVLMVIYVINTEHNTSVKMTWIILIMALPGFGGLLYVFIQRDIGHRTLKRWLKFIMIESAETFSKQEELMERLKTENKGLYNLATYTGKVGSFPIYENSSAEYFSSGEEAFAEILLQLLAAKEFIYLEFFIIEEGYMWGQILKILADKVKEGVEVRVMYDGTCEFARLPHNYPKKIRELGIECKVFSPIRPFISTHYNYR